MPGLRLARRTASCPSSASSSRGIRTGSGREGSSCLRSTAAGVSPRRSRPTGRLESLFDRELGLEPSRELQELERAILNQDPALGVSARRHRVLRRRRRGAVLLVAGGSLLVAAAAAAVVFALSGGSSQTLSGNEVAVISALVRSASLLHGRWHDARQHRRRKPQRLGAERRRPDDHAYRRGDSTGREDIRRERHRRPIWLSATARSGSAAPPSEKDWSRAIRRPPPSYESTRLPAR